MNAKNIISLEAYDLLKNNLNSILLDVRMPEEWKNTGIPKIDNKLILISFYSMPHINNERFTNEVLSKITDKTTLIFTICRAGGRSATAANILSEIGYT